MKVDISNWRRFFEIVFGVYYRFENGFYNLLEVEVYFVNIVWIKNYFVKYVWGVVGGRLGFGL